MVIKSPEGAKGAEQLHAYWVAGPGLEKWSKAAKPWTTLRRHLEKYIHDPHMLDSTTSKWFQEVFHFSAGSDLNRVTHGKPPRGKVIGPG